MTQSIDKEYVVHQTIIDFDRIVTDGFLKDFLSLLDPVLRGILLDTLLEVMNEEELGADPIIKDK